MRATAQDLVEWKAKVLGPVGEQVICRELVWVEWHRTAEFGCGFGKLALVKLVGGMLSRSAHLPSFPPIARGSGDLVRQSPFPIS